MSLQFTHISQKSGLSSTFVRKIVEDPYGFFWIATQDGLGRYDGVKFLNYNGYDSSKHIVSGSDVRDIVSDTANKLLWVISSYGGIDAIDFVTSKVIFSLRQSENSGLKGILFNSACLIDSMLFIGSSNGLFILNTKTEKLKAVSHIRFFSDKISNLWVNNIITDKCKNIWLLCNGYGLLVVKGNGARNIHTNEYNLIGKIDKAKLSFYDCCELYGGILCATDSGVKLYFLKNGKVCIDENLFSFAKILTRVEVFACRVDKDKNIWVSINNSLIKVELQNHKYFKVSESVSRDEWKWLGAVFAIFFDKKNQLWLGCQQGLAYSSNEHISFQAFHKSPWSNEEIGQVYNIYSMNNKEIYIATTNGLYLVNYFTKEIRLLSGKETYYHVFSDSFKKIWVSNSKGTFILEGTHFIPLREIYAEFGQMGKLVFNSHIDFNDSLVFLGTENSKGLIVWNKRNRTVQKVDNLTKGLHLNESVINTIFLDYNSNVWVLGDNSIVILNYFKKETKSLNTYNSKNRLYYSIFFDACKIRGNYFVATYGRGIIEYDSSLNLIGEINTGNGLANNCVYKIIPYKDSLLLISTNDGMTKVSLNTNRNKNYYSRDGLQSDNFEERAGYTVNSLVYLGGVNGFTIIDPQYFRTNTTPPKFYFTNVKTEATDGARDTSNLEMSDLKIPDTWLQTNVSFVGLNYSNPERVTYQYRLIGQNNSWVSLGTQNFINIIGLSPGKYILEVKAANEDGVWCESKKLTLIFLPKWYQTLWFDFAVAMGVIGLLYGFFRYRIRQLKKQQQIRAEIASDLHDDIGSALNTVKVFTHLAKRDEDKMKHISQIEDSVTQAAIGLRDMLWILDDSQDTVQEMLERIKKFALPVAMANGIALECINDAANDSQQISSKTKKRNLLLIAKESINNSIKYADCKNITVTLSQKSNRVTLVIKDDGKGFDMAAVQKGYGLNNIVLRAKQIKAVAEIESSPGHGTKVTIKQ